MKEIIRDFIPPIVLKARSRYIQYNDRNAYSNEKFKEWWCSFKNDSGLDYELVEMIDCFIETDGFLGMSKYWNYLNKKNLEQISESGIENFKQTVATNYYTMVNGINGALGKNIIKSLEDYQLSIPINQITKKHDFLKLDESILFNTMTVLLYEYVSHNYPQIIDDCHEGDLGNPLHIDISGKKVSQDILSSAIEYSSITEGRNENFDKLLELGAGSGRTAEFFLKKHININYVICDIVPALYVSQYYLSNVFSNRKVFKFREFEDYSSIKDEFENSDIAFIMPHQLNLLPNKYFDIFMAIDCLHEMKEEQIKDYFTIADRLGKQFYFKAWKNTDVPFDNIILTEDKYAPLEKWEKVFKRDCNVPSDFFEAMYKC